VVSKIPTGPEDERVHYVITGDCVLDCQNFSAKKISGH
jgi:hypothetical protein